MKITLTNVALGLALVSLASCANEVPWSTGNGTGEGNIKLNLTASNEVSAALPEVRAISTEIIAPPVKDFHIRLIKEDGTTQTWSTVKEFVDESSFSVGIYSIEAYYGDPSTQGTINDSDEGYEYAYYYGITEHVTVLEGQTTDVELHAGLANAIVEIEYSDEFKNYFTDWETTLQTDENSPLKLGSRESWNYVIPGEVSITIIAEQQNGRKLKLKPGTFKAEAQHMYKMRYTVYNSEIGNAQLAIEFDDNLEQDPIIVDLSKELGNMEPPKISTEGFEPDQNFASLEGTNFEGNIKFNVVAPGTISEAVLTINSDTYHPSFLKNGKIDLCKASDEDQKAMSAAGIKAVGFYRNPDELAKLDLTELCKNLPSGVHKFSFQVTDSHLQTNEPIEVTVAVIPKEISAEGQEATFGNGYADIVVSYNGPDPTAPGSNPFSFKIQGEYGFENCEITHINGNPLTRSDAFPIHEYTYRVNMPLTDNDEPQVRVFFNDGDSPVAETKVPFVYPDYKIQLDPMAKSIRIRVDEPDSKKNNLFYRKLHVFVDGKRIESKNLINDVNKGIITIPNLSPGTPYHIQTTLESAVNPKTFGSDNTETTEIAEKVPNGDFEDLVETINTTINQGGRWTITSGGTKYQTTLSMEIKEPRDWMSSNTQTCNLNTSYKNSWYTIPSVYNTTLSWVSHQPTAKILGQGQSGYDSTADVYKNLSSSSNANAMVIRNVAWEVDGQNISDRSQTGKTGEHANYYCSNKPGVDAVKESTVSDYWKPSDELSKISNRTAGYMYLGSASKEGVDFTVRPNKLKGVYKYVQDVQDLNEKGKVIVKLLNGNAVIASGIKELDARDSYADFEVPITYIEDNFLKKPTTLQIKILSSNKESDIKTTDYCNKEECCSRGATLYIDNLTFEY